MPAGAGTFPRVRRRRCCRQKLTFPSHGGADGRLNGSAVLLPGERTVVEAAYFVGAFVGTEQSAGAEVAGHTPLQIRELSGGYQATGVIQGGLVHHKPGDSALRVAW
jgi:hypothetical protein